MKKSIKYFLGVFLKKIYPKSWLIYHIIRNGKLPGVYFEGWGMTTGTIPPWVFNNTDFNTDFLDIQKELLYKVKNKLFTLSQFENNRDKENILSGLMWRHFIVYWSINYALKATELKIKNIAECGVCDGLTVYFALNVLKKSGSDFRCYLYDAWEGMRREYLLDTELGHLGDYAYLNQKKTEENLSDFSEQTIFNRGFIPDSFNKSINPDTLVWLHIDLNSSAPTEAALEFFFDKMPKGAVILFDDYAWEGYKDTRLAVDDFCKDKSGLLQHLPTGQAIFFKL